MNLRAIVALQLTIVAAGCGSVRPTRPPGSLRCGLRDFEVNDIYGGQYRLKAIESVHVLALSAGGEFGAYGAGFLVGWGSVGAAAKPGPRSDIQVVTGVSTGALMATHAFLGEDDVLLRLYTSLSGPQIYRDRTLLDYVWAPSLYSTEGKEALIAANVGDDVVERVIEVAQKTRRELYLGLVDLDSGEFVRIDMVKLAGTLHEQRGRHAAGECFRAVISASSAIPIAFPPRFVDDRMLVDGGARWHMFLTEAQSPQTTPGATPRRVFALVHGDLDVGRHPPKKNGVLQIAERTSSVLTDQTLKTSIRWMDVLAHGGPDGKLPAFDIAYAAAAQAACDCAPEKTRCQGSGGLASEDMFCQPFMECLARRGEADGRDYATGARPWLDLEGVFRKPKDCQLERRLGQ